jgi:hypothetical protein
VRLTPTTVPDDQSRPADGPDVRVTGLIWGVSVHLQRRSHQGFPGQSVLGGGGIRTHFGYLEYNKVSNDLLPLTWENITPLVLADNRS